MKRILLLSTLVLFSVIAHSQSVVIKRVELSGEKIIVVYDLEDSNPNNEYFLSLLFIERQFRESSNERTGDIGMDIKPGTDKRVEWNLVKEYGGYKGKLSLEIRGKVYVPFARIRDFDPKGKYRRGRTYPITWKAGNSAPINIELFKAGQRIAGENNHPNNGSYELYIPTHAKPGDDYKLKFSDPRNPDEVIFTEPFKVRPKIPLLVKVLPGVALVAAIVFLTKGGGGGGNEGEPGEDGIETPPFPTK